jgi:hypothetical protein
VTDARSLLNCENPRGRPSSAFRILRSVNAPAPSRSVVQKIDDLLSSLFFHLLSFHCLFASLFLRQNRTVRCFRCSLERIRSVEYVDDGDVDLHLSLSTSGIFLFLSFTSVILHLSSPATLYRGASIKFIRPLVAATLQDGSRRLATLCFSTLTLSSLLFLCLSLPLLYLCLSRLLPISWVQSLSPSSWSSWSLLSSLLYYL